VLRDAGCHDLFTVSWCHLGNREQFSSVQFSSVQFNREHAPAHSRFTQSCARVETKLPVLFLYS